MAIARTMMLHSAIHWSDVADACLWPIVGFLYAHKPSACLGNVQFVQRF